MAQKVQQNQQAKQTQKEPKKFYDIRPLLKELGLDVWLGAEAEEFVQALGAETKEDWANVVLPYIRRDGKPAHGLAWGISAPATGRVNIVFLRLLEVGAGARAKVQVYANGKGTIDGDLAQALIGAWGLRPWTDSDTAELL